MKRSTQWDIVGVVAILIGVVAWVSVFYGDGGGFFKVGGVKVWLGNPFLIGFAVLFGFMCFLFGHLAGRREV